MPIYLTARPTVNIPANGAVKKRVSRWNAVHNPIRLSFQRKDIETGFVYQQDSGIYSGKLMVYWANGTDINTYIKPGDKLLIGGPSYGKVGTVLVSGPNSATFDINYEDNLGPRFLNLLSLHRDHHVQIELWDSEKNINYGTWEGTANSKGVVRADISGLLKKQLETIDESLFDVPNRKADKSYGKIEFKYREYFLFGYSSWINGGDLFYWTNSAKQIKEKHSGNMAEHVPFNDSSIDEDKKMKFLIEGRPTLFVGYPFDLYWIYPDGFDRHYIERRQQNKTNGGAPTGPLLFTNLASSQRKGVNTLTPNTIDTNTTYFEIWLEGGEALPPDGYVDAGFTHIDFATVDGLERING